MATTDTMACTKCRFYDEHHGNGSSPHDDAGLCRFNPPVSQPDESSRGLWPVVSREDWCGHYTPAGAR